MGWPSRDAAANSAVNNLHATFHKTQQNRGIQRSQLSSRHINAVKNREKVRNFLRSGAQKVAHHCCCPMNTGLEQHCP